MNTKNFEKNLEMLNPEQRKAVETLDGPVMVIAGPGTGKTQIIGMRTANIILKAGVDASNILITTFTEAGVIAIRERLISMIGTDAYKVQVSTIHSFAQDVIKNFPEKFTQEKMNTAIDDVEMLELISEIISEKLASHELEYLTSYGDPLFYVREIKSQIWKLKWEGVSPAKFRILLEEETQKSLAWLEEKRNNKRIKKIESYEEKHEKHIWKLTELADIFEKYNDILREKHLYDFNDMINFVLEKLRIDEEMRAFLAESYHYVMLDEYQDTNNPQNEIMNLICSYNSAYPQKPHLNSSPQGEDGASEMQNNVASLSSKEREFKSEVFLENTRDRENEFYPNIMVVWDDDQSIYRFQGANIENMLDFTSLYPDALLIVLDKNYRSQQGILDVASESISQNSERLIHRIPGLKKDIISQLPPLPSSPCKGEGQIAVSSPLSKGGVEGANVTLYSAPSQEHEEIYILESIKKYIWAWKKYSDIAIIVRWNREVSHYSELLSSEDIPVYSKFETNILDSAIISHIVSFLKVIENPFEHEREFLDLLRCSFSGIDNFDILKISGYLYKENYMRRWNKLKIFEVISDPLKLDILEIKNKASFESFVEKIIKLQQVFAQQNIVFAISELLREFQLLENDISGIDFNDLQDISTFFALVKQWQKYNQNLSVSSLLEKFELYKKYNLRIERIMYKSDAKWVQIVTAHSSKGLEYEHVFIPGLYSGNWDNKVTRNLISLPEWIAGSWLQFAQTESMSDAEKKKYDDERQMQEDRRLFFVALTRAKQSLHLSYPQSIDGKIKIISPLLSEISGLEAVNFELPQELLWEKLSSDILSESRFIEYSRSELEYIQWFFENYKLSASDLNTFLVNPRDFLYRTLLRYPFEENENTIFGTMYHRTLELFYKKIQETGEVQDLSYMHFVYERQLEREFLSDEQRTRLRKRGLEALEGYFNTYEGSFVAPLKTEYRFSRRNIFFEDIPLTGVIDKIELLSDDYKPRDHDNTWLGQNSFFSQAIKITDYKTWSTKYLWDIKWQDKDGNPDENYERGKYGRQLMFYKLLFENDSELSSQYTLWSLELDFCEGKNGKYKRQEVEFSDEEYQSFKKLVRESYGRMTDIDFWREFLRK
jgi:DNA helicase-2/ATP-dependent DNA helicase PcrA